MKNSKFCIEEEKILIPLGYNQGTYIEKFCEKYKDGFKVIAQWGFSGARGETRYTNTFHYVRRERVNDRERQTIVDYVIGNNLSYLTDELIPGMKYTKKLFELKSPKLSSIEEIVTFLKEEGVLFTGMPGLMLSCEFNREQLSQLRGRRLISFSKNTVEIAVVQQACFNRDYEFSINIHDYVPEEFDVILAFNN